MNWTPAESAAWAPPENLTPSEWTERYRELAATTSAEPGRFRWSRVPFLRPIADAARQPGVEEIVVCKPAQIGGTTLFESLIGFWADQDPGPCMLFLADQATAEKISKDRLHPMFRSTPRLAAMIIEAQFNIGDIRLSNGFGLEIGWSSSIAKTASRSIRYLLLDEIDKPGYSVTGEEGGTLHRLTQRTETFGNRVIIKGSTPTVENGNIMRELATCDVVMDWRVPCPRCGAEQPLRFSPTEVPGFGLSGGIVWEGGREASREQIDRACYQCCACSALWSSLEKNEAVSRGRMVPRVDVTRPRKVGYHINRLVSLFDGGTLPALVRGWIAATKSGRHLDLHGYVNSVLAEPWIPRVETREGINLLERRGTLPRRHAPAGAVAFTAGIDVQRYGFWFAVWAWSKALGSWCVDHGELSTWDQVQALIFDTDFYIDGQPRRIWRAGIDTGGGKAHDTDTGEARDWSRTAEAYAWLREHGRGIAWGTKGMSRNSDGRMIKRSIIDRMPGKGGEVIPGGLVLHFLDTDQLNELFDWRMRQAGAQRMNFHADAGADLFDQLTAIEKRRGRDGKEVWKATRPEHLRDCSMIAAACADQQWDGGIPLLAAVIEAEEQRAAERARPAQAGSAQSGGWVGGGSGWIR